MSEEPELDEYRKFVASAARNDSNIPIPNSDVQHAEVLFEAMIPKAKEFIHIFTGNFREIFYSNLQKKFAKLDNKIKIRVLSKAFIPEAEQKKYPNIIFQQVNTNFQNHFMVIDDHIYRFEEKHLEDQEDVEAIANFNDTEMAKDLNKVFSMIEKQH